MNAISIDYVAATKVNGAWGKVAMIRCLLLTVALLVPSATSSQPGTAGPKPDVETYFRQSIGLSQDQIASIRNGKPVTKSLPSRSLAEVFLFGAAYVHAAPERYVKFARDYLYQMPFFPHGTRQRTLTTPGLSLSATSSTSEAAASCVRHESRFYGETFSAIGEASADRCPGRRLILERVREPGVSGLTDAETRAWLSGIPSAATCSSNISLIVGYWISWNKLVNFWCPTMPVRLVVLSRLSPRRI